MAGALVLSTACTAGAPSPTGAPAVEPGRVPSDVQTVVHRAIDRFNATAGGPIAAQQAELAGAVAPAQRSAQLSCPAPTGTIALDPVYDRLAAAPRWKPSSGVLPGTLYALPTLIRIYTGNRLTATDLTELHLSVTAGRVEFAALCVG